MIQRTVLLLAVVLSSCTAPSQRDPSRYGTVRVAFGPSLDGTYAWRPDQLAELAPMFVELDAIGPDFVTATEGSADVVVRAASLGGACGQYSAGLAYVEADAACSRGYLSLRRAVAHELIHWYTWSRWAWAGHLCDWPIGAPVPPHCHPTIRCRDCVMSPGLVAPDEGPTFTEAYTGAIAEPTPAERDLALVASCASAGRCVP